MEEKKIKAREKFRGGFRSEQRRMFWLDIRAKALLVLFTSGLIGLADIFFIRSRDSFWLPLTEKDIEIFTRIDIKYSIPFWWDFLFGVIWAFLLYWLSTSRWFRKKTGLVMRNLLVALVIIGGFYFSALYGGILYGLVLSLAFLILLAVPIIVHWLLKFLSEITKIFFD